jgi:putative ABC transport system permease protein
VLALIWMRGLLVRRLGRIVGAVAGVAVAVALLASIGAFLSASKATMTRRSVAGVAVDWQVEAQTGADPAAVLAATVEHPHVLTALPVEFGRTTGFEATTGGSTQTTGPGVVLGLPAAYRDTFPGEIRDLAGAKSGVLLAQQTAANLHVAPGDTVQIGLAGMSPQAVTIDGIIDLPAADTLFQSVGAPAGAQPQAPPDNVLVITGDRFTAAFGPLLAARPDLVHHQVHVRLDHRLPDDPSAAYVEVSGQARNLEVKLAGAGLVGDNTGATLAAARKDALYAQVLFLFLGMPGVVLAGLLTATVAAAGADRRRREQALLRTRGATTAQLLRLASAEGLLVGVMGAAVGLLGALVLGRLAFGTASFGATRATAAAWIGLAAVVGIVIALATVTLPARTSARSRSVVASRRQGADARAPLWRRYPLDLALLAIGGVVFWLTGRNDYTLVLAPEGVPTISVSYWAFAGPAFLWVGAGLFSLRLADAGLSRGRAFLGKVLTPLCGGLAPTVAAGLARQRAGIARALMLVSLTTSFAASTAIFNATYRQQADVDAILSNGADVTVTVPTGATLSKPALDQVRTAPGVRSVESFQHRYAYVGADLQDMYGVNPRTIGRTGRLQDAYFQGGSAKELLGLLESAPDSVLVSAETVRDFQLQKGDPITLRLQDARTKALEDVTFHYVGVVKEFPTAPSDSFLLANASYLASETGTDAPGALLLDTGGHDQPAIARRLQASLGTAAQVTDLTSERRVIGSSLTSVDLSGLTKLELGFALLLAAGATGLTLGLGLAERRRAFAIAAALGARPGQIASFVWAEALVLGIGGIGAGAVSAWALTNMLIKVLTGVFDPAPAHLAIPVLYLTAAAAIAAASLVGAATSAIVLARRGGTAALRDL